jgi:hypothetical protein
MRTNMLDIVKIQRSIRMHLARKQLGSLRHDRNEEIAWLASLAKRRERIQRLEKELRLLEDLPAEAIARLDTNRFGYLQIYHK